MSVDVESREYNNRWYTEVKAYRVDKNGGNGSAPSSNAPEVDTFYSDSEEDKLPF